MTSNITLHPSDQAAIDDLLAGMADAWAHGDGTAYGALFTPDAHYITAPGQRLTGADAIARAHQEVFDGFFRGTCLGAGYSREVEVITPDVVLIHTSGAVLFAGEQEQKVAPNGLITMLLVKHDGTWLIDSFTNTPTGTGRTVRFFTRYLKARMRPSARKLAES